MPDSTGQALGPRQLSDSTKRAVAYPQPAPFPLALRAIYPIVHPMDIITSRQNALIKRCIKLHESRRERSKQAMTLLDGEHLIEAATAAGEPLERLLVSQTRAARGDYAALLEKHAPIVSIIDDGLFGEMSDLESSTGLLGLWPIPASPAAIASGFVLALDGVQDPGNVGAILRTASAVGVDQVWLGMGSADPWSPKVLRAGMGAQFVVPVVERLPLSAALTAFAGQIVVTSLEGSVPLYEADLQGDLAMVLGSEGQGVSDEVLAAATLRIRIPMQPGIESLNVGAAAAVCLYERYRQSTAR